MTRRVHALLLAGIGLSALLWFLPALQVGWLSDDFGIAAYLDRESGAADWGRALADFAQPWGAPTLYRPVVSLSLALNWTLGHGPIGFHLFNLLLVAVAAAATARTAALLLPQRPLLALLAAGLVAVLHPAMVEPATWIAARTSGLELCFSTLALAAFAKLANGQGSRRWPYAAWILLALFSKEGALTLPLALLCVDMWTGVPRPLRQRLRLHAPGLAVWLGYLACRTAVLGSYGAGAEPMRVRERLLALLQHAGELVTPPVPQGWWLLLPLLLLLLPLVRTPRLLLLGALWLLAGLLPTSLLRDQGPAFHGRYVCTAVPALAVLLAAGVAAAPRRWRWPALAAAVALLLGFGLASRHWLGQYERAGDHVRALQAAVIEAADACSRATEGSGVPLGLVALGDDGIPVSMLQQPLWPALLRWPYADRDRDVVALSGLLDRAVAAPGMFGDPRPWRALLDAGGALATWDAGSRSVRCTTVVPARLGEFAPTAPGVFAPPQPLPPLLVAAIEVELPQPARECSLQLVDDVGGGLGLGQLQLRDAAGRRQFVFDLTPAMAPVLWQAGKLPFRGCQLQVDGAPAPTLARVRPLARPGLLELPTLLRGAALRREQVPARLVRPAVQLPLRLYLLLPSGPVAVDDDGAGGRLGEGERFLLQYAADTFAPCRVAYFWQRLQADADGPLRSPLDWFTLR